MAASVSSQRVHALMVGVLLLLFNGASATAAQESRPSDGESGETTECPWWSCLHGGVDRTVSIARTREGEVGGRLSYGFWNEEEFVFGINAFVEDTNSENGDLWRAGIALTAPVIGPLGPVRIGPRIRLGVHGGPGGHMHALASVGGEIALWLGSHCQLAATADRNFYGDTTNQVAFEVRFAWPDKDGR